MIISMADINPLFWLSLFHFRFFLRQFPGNLMKPSQLNQLTPLHSRYILPYFCLPLQDNALQSGGMHLLLSQGILRELCLNNIPRIVILLKIRYSSLVPFGGRFHARMKICLQKGTKGAPLYEQKRILLCRILRLRRVA